MIQRQLPRTLSRLKPPPSQSTCKTCTCRCGSSFQSSTPPHHEQRRTYARRAPSTIDRSIAREAIPLTPAQAAKRRDQVKYHSEWFSRSISSLCNTGHLDTTPAIVFQFLDEFSTALEKSRGQNGVEPKILLGLLEKYGFHCSLAETLSRVLLRDDIPANLYQGKLLLYSLSRAGYVESTIRVMAHAMLQSRGKPGVLKSREIAFAREHLTKVANSEGGNFRAMVLEGKIALNLGNEEYAIEMFNKAMEAAVEVSEFQLASPKAKREGVGGDALELTAPWHELMQVHHYRSTVKGLNEMHLCEAAMEIGCQQDDPMAHKFKADYVKRWERVEVEDGSEEMVHIGTSDWLYHITKAASSGVPQACHELGVFYAESGWKYIEDEPPEHVKPTPFDSYPSSQPISSFWNNLIHFLGLKEKKITPQERSFHNAIFPHTAVDRLKMSLGWLTEAMEYHYAPSYLMVARLYNRKTLWAQANAPVEALQLQDARYTYASQSDFEAGKPIPESILSKLGVTRLEENEDPPNPLYDPESAKKYLCEVFAAYEAHRHESRMKTSYQKGRVEGTIVDKFADDDEALSLNIMLKKGGLPPKLGKWFKFPEVREVNGGVVRGLWEEAKAVCEEEGWVLMDGEGGLVYKSGLGEKKL